MVKPLEDVADPRDPTLIAVHKSWAVADELLPKLGLHVHGDAAAQRRGDELSRDIAELRSTETPLTLSALDSRIGQLAAQYGLKATVTKTRCAFDPLEVAVDVSIWSERE